MGGKMKETGIFNWKSPNTGATNESNFSAIPTGWVAGSEGFYPWDNEYARFWSSNDNNESGGGLNLKFDNSNADFGGASKDYGLSVRCIQDVPTGTIDISEPKILPPSDLVAYPNPTSGILNIEFTITEDEIYTIELINSSGKVIMEQRINVLGGKFEIDMSGLNSGFYVLKAMTNKKVQLTKVIKQ